MDELTHSCSPNPGWPHEDRDVATGGYGITDGNTQIRNMEYVYLANFTGCPALSAPVGFLDPPDAVKRQTKGEGKVPVGLMGMGDWGSEDELVAFGYDVEAFLHGGLEGGRVRPRGGEDVLEMVAARN